MQSVYIYAVCVGSVVGVLSAEPTARQPGVHTEAEGHEVQQDDCRTWGIYGKIIALTFLEMLFQKVSHFYWALKQFCLVSLSYEGSKILFFSNTSIYYYF